VQLIQSGGIVRYAYLFAERPSSGIAGWRGGLIARIGSEGTRPALLPAGPVPERWNVESVLIETPHGQRLTARVCSAHIFPSICDEWAFPLKDFDLDIDSLT